MEQIIKDFYTAFSNLDVEGMVKHYHPKITFTDPAFGILKGEQAKNMWRMLCEAQKKNNSRIELKEVSFDGEKGYAKWEAFYPFSQTGKKVHNKISSEFQFKDNLIINHIDTFNLHTWAKQAMGFKGLLLGGTNFFKSKLQQQTNRLLDNYIKANQNKRI